MLLDGDRLASVRSEHLRKGMAYQGYSRDQMATSKPFQDDQDIPSPLATSRATSLRRTVSLVTSLASRI